MTEDRDPSGLAEPPLPQRQLRGQVKWFDSRKGFGFVTAEGESRDVLLHINVLRSFGQNSIAEGTSVLLRVQESARGIQAVEVLELEPAPPQSHPDLPDLAARDLSALPLLPARVKWFDRAKGFGFANVWGAPQDVFLHAEVLRRGGFAELQPGEAVAVKVVEGQRGKLAGEVHPWDSALAATPAAPAAPPPPDEEQP